MYWKNKKTSVIFAGSVGLGDVLKQSNNSGILPTNHTKEKAFDKTERALPLLLQHHAALQDEALSRQEKKERCKEILKKIENDEVVIKLFDDLVSQLKVGELLSIK